MKKAAAGLILALILCATLAISASAEAPDAAWAIDAFEKFLNEPTQKHLTTATDFLNYFYIDMDCDGLPELFIVREDLGGYPGHKDTEAEVFRIKKKSEDENHYGIPYVLYNLDGFVEEFIVSTTIEKHRSRALDLVAFGDGSYGLCWTDLETWEKLYRRYDRESGTFVDTGDAGESVYSFTMQAPIPGKYQLFAKPFHMAYASSSPILLDSKETDFAAYTLRDAYGDANYFSIREVARKLSGTKAQFDVRWNQQTSTINIVPGTAYSGAAGKDAEPAFSGDQLCMTSDAKVTVSGDKRSVGAITITDSAGGDHTYFKLRDLSRVIGFVVDWNAEKEQIEISTTAKIGKVPALVESFYTTYDLSDPNSKGWHYYKSGERDLVSEVGFERTIYKYPGLCYDKSKTPAENLKNFVEIMRELHGTLYEEFYSPTSVSISFDYMGGFMNNAARLTISYSEEWDSWTLGLSPNGVMGSYYPTNAVDGMRRGDIGVGSPKCRASGAAGLFLNGLIYFDGADGSFAKEVYAALCHHYWERPDNNLPLNNNVTAPYGLTYSHVETYSSLNCCSGILSSDCGACYISYSIANDLGENRAAIRLFK